MKLPRLRALEFIPHREGEINGFIVRDPLMLTGNVIFIPEPVAFILSFFDGEREFVDVQEAFLKKYGEMLFTEDIERLIDDFDSQLLLDNENYRSRLDNILREYREAPYRKLHSLPRTYKDFSLLRERIREKTKEKEEPEKGIISPHIDYERGLEGYSLAYSGWRAFEGKTLIFLGVNHTPFSDKFILTGKGYETPWGNVEPDLEAIKALEEVLEDPYGDELAHAFEHSIELNVAFLKALMDNFKMVGLLVPSFVHSIEEGKLPEGYEPVFEVLHELSSLPGYFLVSASDLSHYGLRFGDGVKAEKLLPSVEAFDRRILEQAERGNGDGFLSLFFPHKNATHVCGTGSIYVFLKSINTKGKLLGYFNALDPDGGSAVSFAALIY